MPVIKLRVSEQLKRDLKKRAQLEHTTMSQLIRDVMVKYLDGRVVTVDMSPDKWVKAPNWTLTATEAPYESINGNLGYFREREEDVNI